MTGDAPPAAPTAAMLVIGDEILSGRTRDANAHHLAGVMENTGIRLCEIRVIGDEHDRIVEAVRALSAAHTHVFTSGGIGPTHDDITADAVAAAFGASIDVRADARAILERYYAERADQAGGLNAARLRMARIPDGATLIDNPVSRAPGFSLQNVHVMAGVPAIFREMLAGLAPQLQGGPRQMSWSFRGAIPEGELADGLGQLADAHAGVSIGCYPFYRGGLGSTIILRSADRAALTAAADAARDFLSGFGKDLAETPPEPKDQ